MAIALNSCAGQPPATIASPLADEGCPVIVLERRGGLGAEARSGVIAAVWRSGRIVRAASTRRPWGRHVAGRLKPEDLASLLLLVDSEAGWKQPSGEVALDMPDDVLTLERAGERREWAETPGFTSTPLVTEFRQRLVRVAIERSRRTHEPFELPASCDR